MKKIIFLIFIGFGSIAVFSQSLTPEVTACAGDYFQGTSATLSWTLGEPITETLPNASNILTQGFQQSKYTIVNISEIDDSDYQITVYPNPSNDLINIEYKKEHIDIIIELFDVQGRKLVSKEMRKNETKKQINLNSFSIANYFLRISTKDGKLLKTFKIIKR